MKTKKIRLISDLLLLNSYYQAVRNTKKLQEQSEYGSDEYLYYKILQLTFKVLANSYYGILGGEERNSVFYNSHVRGPYDHNDWSREGFNNKQQL